MAAFTVHDRKHFGLKIVMVCHVDLDAAKDSNLSTSDVLLVNYVGDVVSYVFEKNVRDLGS